MHLTGDEGLADPTKLHIAIKEVDINTIKYMLRSNKNVVHARDNSGRTALHWTVVLGSHRSTKIILKRTSWWYLDRCDYNGCTPLHYAAQAGRSEETRMLLKRGVSANARDVSGKTPMHYAVLVGNAFIIQRLYDHKGDLWMRDKDGNLPLDLTNDKPDIISLVRRLMKPKILCFRLFYPKPTKEKGRLNYAEKFPYGQKANKVNRCLPKDMLRDMMIADALRNKHELEHKEMEYK